MDKAKESKGKKTSLIKRGFSTIPGRVPEAPGNRTTCYCGVQFVCCYEAQELRQDVAFLACKGTYAFVMKR